MKLIHVVALLAAFTPLGCWILEPDSNAIFPAGNILENSSFEIAGAPSLLGWYKEYHDTDRTFSSTEACPGGGHFSLGINNNNYSPYSYVKQMVAVPIGRHIFRVSVWAKNMTPAPQSGLVMGPKGGIVMNTQIHPTDTNWTFFSTLDTLTIGYPDSVFVTIYSLKASWGESSQTLWDQCILQIIE